MIFWISWAADPCLAQKQRRSMKCKIIEPPLDSSGHLNLG